MLNERGITIEELMTHEIMKNAKLIAGKEGICRVITGVNIMEVPDILDWVKAGELLITTAYSIKDDEKAQRELIPMLNEKGLPGLAIKPKRYLQRVPQVMIDEANKLGFPIIELPYDLSFSDLMNDILLEVHNRQSDVLMRMDEIHQKIMEVVLNGGKLKEIGETLYNIIKNPLVIKDHIFEKSVTVAPENEKEMLEKEIKKVMKGKNQYEEPCDNYCEENTYKKVKEKLEGKDICRCIFPIIAGKKLYGEIHIWEFNKNITAVDIRAIQYACAVVALELMKEITIFEVENRHKNEFLEDLLSSDAKIRSSCMEKAEIFGLGSCYKYEVFLLYIDELEKKFSDNPGENGSKSKTRLMKIIENAVNLKGTKILTGSKGNNITILMAFSKNGQDECHKSSGLNIAKRIADAITDAYDIVPKIGIGRCCMAMDDLWQSMEEAKKALSFARIFNNKIIHYDDLGIFRLLCVEHQEEEIRKFYTENIEPLRRYDEQKDGELIKTLTVYFECGGNLKKVAEKMYIHYNTILYRINKIQQITKMDLSNSNDRLNLEVSLKIMNMIDDPAFLQGKTI